MLFLPIKEEEETENVDSNEFEPSLSSLSVSLMKMKNYHKSNETKKREQNHLRNLKLALEEAVVSAFILKENALFFETEGFVNAKRYCEDCVLNT